MDRDVPRKYDKLYKTARSGNSRKARIKAHCLECCGWDRKEVTLCADKGCIFYKIRLSG